MKSGLVHERATLTKEQEIWLTPPHILRALGDFDLDPCAAPDPKPWPTARKHYTLPTEDGLLLPWEGRVWLNPPYGSACQTWIERLAMHGNGMALVFARTETALWQSTIFKTASGLMFVERRIQFHTPNGECIGVNAGAPSALIAWGADNFKKLKESGIKGFCIQLS